MAIDYNEIAQGALESIKEAGGTLAILRSRPSFDDITGTPTPDPSPQSGKLSAVVLPRYKGVVFRNMDEAFREALVKGRAKSVLAAASDATFPPEPNDELTIEGSQWRIIGVTVLAPAGVPLVYTIGVMQ